MRSWGELAERPKQGVDVAVANLRCAAHALHDRVAGFGLVGKAIDVFVEQFGSVSARLSRNAAPEPVNCGTLGAEVAPAIASCIRGKDRVSIA
jgi:hypothetical protein